MRPFYQDYVFHMLRFYFSYDKEPKHFKRHADKLNYTACNRVMKNRNSFETEIIKEVACYGLWTTTVAQLHDTTKDNVYSIVGKTAKEIAKKRGLL